MKKVFGEDAPTKKAAENRYSAPARVYRTASSPTGRCAVCCPASAPCSFWDRLCGVYFAARALLTRTDRRRFCYLVPGAVGRVGIGAGTDRLIINFAALMCSHTAAFHTEKNLKMAALRHLSRMPMGYFEENPSGKLRKIIDENSAQMETYLAHQLPDLVSAQVTTVASLVLMLAMDWLHWPSADRSDACKLCLPDDNDGQKKP